MDPDGVCEHCLRRYLLSGSLARRAELYCTLACEACDLAGGEHRVACGLFSRTLKEVVTV